MWAHVHHYVDTFIITDDDGGGCCWCMWIRYLNSALKLCGLVGSIFFGGSGNKAAHGVYMDAACSCIRDARCVCLFQHTHTHTQAIPEWYIAANLSRPTYDHRYISACLHRTHSPRFRSFIHHYLLVTHSKMIVTSHYHHDRVCVCSSQITNNKKTKRTDCV